jgi:hypothetical protein
MLLASIGTDGHSDASVKESSEARISVVFYALVNEIQIDLNALTECSCGKLYHGLDARMRGGCG